MLGIVPSSNIYYRSYSNSWYSAKLFQPYLKGLGPNMEEMLINAKENFLGKTFSVLITFEILGIKNDYIFNW